MEGYSSPYQTASEYTCLSNCRHSRRVACQGNAPRERTRAFRITDRIETDATTKRRKEQLTADHRLADVEIEVSASCRQHVCATVCRVIEKESGGGLTRAGGARNITCAKWTSQPNARQLELTWTAWYTANSAVRVTQRERMIMGGLVHQEIAMKLSRGRCNDGVHGSCRCPGAWCHSVKRRV